MSEPYVGCRSIRQLLIEREYEQTVCRDRRRKAGQTKPRLKPGRRPGLALAYLQSLNGAWASIGDVARHLKCCRQIAHDSLCVLASKTPPLAESDGRGKFRSVEGAPQP